jgi:hypothetical protein
MARWATWREALVIAARHHNRRLSLSELTHLIDRAPVVQPLSRIHLAVKGQSSSVSWASFKADGLSARADALIEAPVIGSTGHQSDDAAWAGHRPRKVDQDTVQEPGGRNHGVQAICRRIERIFGAYKRRFGLWSVQWRGLLVSIVLLTTAASFLEACGQNSSQHHSIFGPADTGSGSDYGYNHP